MAENSLIKIDSKPLEKLIEVIKEGCGILFEPKRIRRKAKAEAEALSILEEAKRQVKLKNTEADIEIFNRMGERLLNQELKRQNNLDNINLIAAEKLSLEDEVSDEKVDEDWVNRFFDIAKDISNEEMQLIWGHILAGEIKQPKSFSVRTLDILKNLSKQEAHLFKKFGEIAFNDGRGNYFILDTDNGTFLENKFQVKFLEKLILEEVGLISSHLNHIYFLDIDPKLETIGEFRLLWFYGAKGIAIRINDSSPTFRMKFERFTFSNSGGELTKLIDTNYDEEYLYQICLLLKKYKVDVKYGDLVWIKDGEYELENEITIE